MKQSKISKVGLLGTKYTMDEIFYTSRIEANDIQLLLPDKLDRAEVNRIIYEALCVGELQKTKKVI
ncbi:hypothetical protein DXF96_12210 [Heyndrickxia coagulans]|nr:hypothetical protein CYJ15_06695 [Heyndrickxia coagulans]QDI62181.1 hypothetical protein DXF96_12210 [Heyndrickxia coagulans]